jgi:AraC family transcriptional regulator
VLATWDIRSKKCALTMISTQFFPLYPHIGEGFPHCSFSPSFRTDIPSSQHNPLQGLTQQQMTRVMDFVQAHLGQDLSLGALAEQAGFSSYHFARLFRQTTGASPHQFVLRQRIERAQHLLKERDVPLARAARECGFANQSHLTQAFKRYLGLTPRAYRQSCSIEADF